MSQIDREKPGFTVKCPTQGKKPESDTSDLKILYKPYFVSLRFFLSSIVDSSDCEVFVLQQENDRHLRDMMILRRFKQGKGKAQD